MKRQSAMLIIKENHAKDTIRYPDILEEKEVKDIQMVIY